MTVIAWMGEHPGEYEVTPEDRLWLLRAVEVEGKPREMVARALVNLFALTRSKGSSAYGTLASLVRAYAQPVNPRWFQQGDLYLAALAKAPNATAAARLRKAAKHRELVHARRMTFSPQTRAAVDAALKSGWQSDVTDYAAPTLDASKKYVPRSEPVAGENRLWTRAVGWAGYMVRSGADGGAGPLVAILLVLGALALWGHR